jgi:hypothetical protein
MFSTSLQDRNSRSGCCIHLLPSLIIKTRPEQLLGYHPLSFVLPDMSQTLARKKITPPASLSKAETQAIDRLLALLASIRLTLKTFGEQTL